MESKKICSCFVLVILAVVNGRPCPALPQLEHAVHNFCEIPRAPDNGRFEFPPNTRKFQAGSRIVLRCVDGFVPNGGNTQTCLSDGTWDGISPKCIDRANSAENIPINKSRRRKRGKNADRAKLAKLPFGNDLFNGEESKLEDLTNSHVGTERADNANTKSRPPIPSNERVDNPSNITNNTNLSAGTRVGTNVTNSSDDGECLPTGRRNGQPPGCEGKKRYEIDDFWKGLRTGFGPAVIIIIVIIIIVVLFIVVIKRQKTTSYHLNGKKQMDRTKSVELIGLIHNSGSESALPILPEHKSVDIHKDGKKVRSVRQKDKTHQSKRLPPRPAIVSSNVTRERPVTSTTSQTAIYQMNNVTNNSNYGERNTVKNEGSASVSSDDKADSPSPSDVTVVAIKETSMFP